MSNKNYTTRGLNALEEFSTDMERVFDSLFGRSVNSAQCASGVAKFVPALDVAETAEEFQIFVDLPGVNPADVKLEMHEGKLTISGARGGLAEEKETQHHRVERSHGEFFRAVSIPNDVDIENIDAKYDNGVLYVRIPKSAKPQPKKIEIRTAN